MSFLVDTNVISEIRKGQGANPGVRRWWTGAEESEIFLSVLVVGEICRGIEKIRPKDRNRAAVLENWLQVLQREFGDRLLPVDLKVEHAWGSMSQGKTLPVVDGLLAATAVAANLTLVTRNTRNMKHLGVSLLNPFS